MARERRKIQISEQVRQILSKALLELSNKDLSMVSITRVKATVDLGLMSVYWNLIGSHLLEEGRRVRQLGNVEESLNRAKGLLRAELTKEMKIKRVPDIRFFYDDTLDVQSERLSKFQ